MMIICDCDVMLKYDMYVSLFMVFTLLIMLFYLWSVTRGRPDVMNHALIAGCFSVE